MFGCGLLIPVGCSVFLLWHANYLFSWIFRFSLWLRFASVTITVTHIHTQRHRGKLHSFSQRTTRSCYRFVGRSADRSVGWFLHRHIHIRTQYYSNKSNLNNYILLNGRRILIRSRRVWRGVLTVWMWDYSIIDARKESVPRTTCRIRKQKEKCWKMIFTSDLDLLVFSHLLLMLPWRAVCFLFFGFVFVFRFAASERLT